MFGVAKVDLSRLLQVTADTTTLEEYIPVMDGTKKVAELRVCVTLKDLGIASSSLLPPHHKSSDAERPPMLANVFILESRIVFIITNSTLLFTYTVALAFSEEKMRKQVIFSISTDHHFYSGRATGCAHSS